MCYVKVLERHVACYNTSLHRQTETKRKPSEINTLPELADYVLHAGDFTAVVRKEIPSLQCGSITEAHLGPSV